MKQMKLFIWNDPYAVNYGSSLLFAIAEDVEKAKEIAFASRAYKYGQFEEATPKPFDLGMPTRILDVPCAEWHEWSE